MLTITETARDLVRKIPNQPMLPTTAGLRIFCRQNQDGSLTVKAEKKPREGDQVLDYDGARIFLGERAAPSLKDKVLDALLDDSGRIQFVLTAVQREAAA
ncbi:MAG TPA: Fe-S cluster assembly protein HesB [Nocardioidaceae bacterium]|nr:Fe-S cluster assembly protein HesB [Nocardioidaceae bacterium]